MYVEDAVSAQGPIQVNINPTITVAELKQQVNFKENLEELFYLSYFAWRQLKPLTLYFYKSKLI